MNLLSLGSAGRRLFAIHEPAATATGRPRAVVICNPLGDEYLYAHRSLRHLAIRLSRRGFHALRFDYFGTGDSAGVESDISIAGMESDVESVIEVAQDIAGAPKVVLVGLRIGANIAARVASRLPGAVESAVLWDPIVSGNSYLKSMNLRPSGPASVASSGMQRDLRAMEFPDVSGQLTGGSLVLVTESEEPAALPDITGMFRPGVWLNSEVVSAPCCWVESATTSGALPVAIVQRIEAWLR